MLVAKRVDGCEAHENFPGAEDPESSAEAELDQVLKDERANAHAEEFRECGKAGDLPSVSGIQRGGDTRHQRVGGVEAYRQCRDDEGSEQRRNWQPQK